MGTTPASGARLVLKRRSVNNGLDKAPVTCFLVRETLDFRTLDSATFDHVKSVRYMSVDSDGFFARVWNAALAVATPTSSSRPTSRQDRPSARRAATRAQLTSRRGRPSRLPRARAAASPERTRSRISCRSNSAMLAKIPNTSRPFGVDVSTPSWSATN